MIDLVDALLQFLNYPQAKQDNVFEFDFGDNEPPESPDAEMLHSGANRHSISDGLQTKSA